MHAKLDKMLDRYYKLRGRIAGSKKQVMLGLDELLNSLADELFLRLLLALFSV
jgi:hypothetical protein